MVAAHKAHQIEGLAGGCARSVCHVILQRCAGRDMLDDAAAEAQLAEADELLTAVLFVPMGGKFFRFLVIVKVFAGFCLRTRKKMV